MRKLITYLSIAALTLSSIGWDVNDVYAHSGGLDARGGHCVGGKARDGSCPSGDYHCHQCSGTEETNYWVIGSVIVGVVVVLYWWGSMTSNKYLVKTNKDEFKPFEPYTTFDVDTKEFETGLRYKYEF